MTNNLDNKWAQCLQIIKDNIGEQQYKSWFLPIKVYSLEDNILTLSVPTIFFCEYLEEHYLDLIKKTLIRVYGDGIQLRYRAGVVENPEVSVEVAPTTQKSGVKFTKNIHSIFKQDVYEELDSQLNSNYKFENYYAGESNMLARTAGLSIAQTPGKSAFNPLFIHGESGVGKTHLMQAIGHKIKELNPRARVLYISSHLFQLQFVNATRSNTVPDFINFYQSLDVLMIDDIQDMADKTQTQNTFFHIFNHLHQNNKQLILSSDRPPVSLGGILPRLISRFKWGLLAEVERPDYELRYNILKNKIQHDGLPITDDVARFVAQNISENVRDLEGVLASLMFRATTLKKDVTLDLAEKVLSTSVNIEKKQITIELIKEKVCAFYNMDVQLLQAKCRKREIVQARQISMYLSKKYTESSLQRIGAELGKKDHATVLHACKTISDLIEIDKTIKSNVEEIEASLRR
ncbi:MAG: chromosomal replication initiator protein DnaA [Bacteroidales bacterium]|nr:chromosomal replication initiator protein DnaA [Bacteroidales bacterium]